MVGGALGVVVLLNKPTLTVLCGSWVVLDWRGILGPDKGEQLGRACAPAGMHLFIVCDQLHLL